MKKTFALITLVAASVTCASAQMWVGGSLGFGHKASETEGQVDKNFNSKHDYNSLSFSPEIGYDLNDRWSVAVGLEYAHSVSEYESIFESTSTTTTNSFSIEPYVRYHALKWGKLGLFVDGGVSYGFSHINGSGDTSNDFAVFVSPGLSYRLNDRFVLVSHISGLKYTHSWYDEADNNSDVFNFGLSSSLSLGVYFYLK